MNKTEGKMFDLEDQRELHRQRLIFDLTSLDDDERINLKRYIRAFDMRLSRNIAFSKIPCGPVITIDTTRILLNPRTNNKYKTELCKYFIESGVCKFQGDCTFAHGLDELRQGQRKAVLCRLFHMTQNCPYGDQCAFIHDEYRRSSLIIQPGYLYNSQDCSMTADYRRSRRSSSGYGSVDE